jgi:hypothetical protein
MSEQVKPEITDPALPTDLHAMAVAVQADSPVSMLRFGC